MRNAIEETDEGCIIHLKVKLGERRRFPAGYDEWRKRIEIEVNEEPVRGRANRQIRAMMADFFALNGDDVVMVYGHKAKEKGVLVKRSMLEVEKFLKNGL
ncbi:MAG: hypothetical protein DRN21_01995 [Thermoplasmata archaeon]|nr:MAG: hypothetical protein DRN21_01995 [Thermoplasmata archaeon]